MAIIKDSTVFLQSNIRTLRKRLSHSQEELAQRIGLNRGNIASYENGSAEPKICNLLKLANLFKVTIIDLTQRDLSSEDTYNTAIQKWQQTTDAEKEFIKGFIDHSSEIEKFLQSIHTCQKYKMKFVENVPDDVKFAFYNFEQLYEATQSLLRDNKEMIGFICCKMKEHQPEDTSLNQG